MTKKKLRCAVIGLGMGKSHCRSFHSHPDAELVAVVDKQPERLDEWKEVVGAGGQYDDHLKMLEKVQPDVVGTALPNFLHASVAIDALKAGAHVFGEKPMAMTVAECREMIAAAERADRQLGINLSYRATPAAQALKDLADDGFLGEPYHAYTRWTRRDGFPGFGGWFGQKKLSGGGPLIDLGVHRIDLAMWLMGNPQPLTVSGQAHRKIGIPRAKEQGKDFDVEDLAAGFVRFDNGASLVFEISWAGHQNWKEDQFTRVMGTEGALVQRNTDGNYTFTAEAFNRVGDITLNLRPYEATGANQPARFIDAVRDGTPFNPAGHDGLRMQEILEGLYRSARESREIQVSEL
ncbi:MAG: Gfo/Idh/MocA family protein [Opitutales bacterium]